MSEYISVFTLNSYIKMRFDEDSFLNSVIYLTGELSNFKPNSSGSIFFTLKDNQSEIKCVIWKNNSFFLDVNSFKDGDSVNLVGTITEAVKYGYYSFYVKKMEKKGVGVLFDKYQRTLEYYKSKGYYLSERKRPIPKFPKKIGVITASTGAVIQDIITTVSSRYPIAEIVLFPTIVQGKDAKTSISSNIYKANTHDDLDVLIIGRGGGSFEDLFAFNEEEVIEAIYLSRIPTITAIGHETDTSISDFVSDLRAPTPTSAATLATPHKIELFLLIKNLKNNLYKNTVNKLLELRHNLDHLTYILEKSSIKEKIRNKKLVLENLVKYLKINLNNNLLLKRRRTLELVNNLKRNKINLKILEFYNLISKLNSLNEANYKKVILNNQKKFNVLNNRLLELKNVFKDFLVKVNKNIIKSIDDFKVGDTLEVEFITGNVVSIVKEINKNG